MIEYDLSSINENKETRPIKRGGVLKVESEEARVQELRERNVLMALYSREEDIPDSPSELALTAEPNAEMKFKTIPLHYDLAKSTRVISIIGKPNYSYNKDGTINFYEEEDSYSPPPIDERDADESDNAYSPPPV